MTNKTYVQRLEDSLESFYGLVAKTKHNYNSKGITGIEKKPYITIQSEEHFLDLLNLGASGLNFVGEILGLNKYTANFQSYKINCFLEHKIEEI